MNVVILREAIESASYEDLKMLALALVFDLQRCHIEVWNSSGKLVDLSNLERAALDIIMK